MSLITAYAITDNRLRYHTIMVIDINWDIKFSINININFNITINININITSTST